MWLQSMSLLKVHIIQWLIFAQWEEVKMQQTPLTYTHKCAPTQNKKHVLWFLKTLKTNKQKIIVFKVKLSVTILVLWLFVSVSLCLVSVCLCLCVCEFPTQRPASADSSFLSTYLYLISHQRLAFNPGCSSSYHQIVVPHGRLLAISN